MFGEKVCLDVGGGEVSKLAALKDDDGIDRAFNLDELAFVCRVDEICPAAGEEGIDVGNVKSIGFAVIERPGKV